MIHACINVLDASHGKVNKLVVKKYICIYLGCLVLLTVGPFSSYSPASNIFSFFFCFHQIDRWNEQRENGTFPGPL